MTISSITQTIDLLPTLIDLFEVRCDTTEVQGRSLLPLIEYPTSQINRYGVTMASGVPGKYMIRDPRYALLLYGNAEWRAFYALADDPDMRSNVLAEHPERAAEMIEAFRTFASAQRRPALHALDPDYKRLPFPNAAETKLTPAMKKELRNLGYLK
jgi:arylsulfatase A-like enzyme